MEFVKPLFDSDRQESKQFDRIRAELLRAPGAIDATVFASKQLNGECMVVAALTVRESSDVNPIGVQFALKRTLPSHLLPDRILIVQCSDVHERTLLAA